jgi:uncharacterized protein YjbI with pentapeptide repeats
LSALCDREVGRLLGLPNPEGIGALVRQGVLHDFTEADLSAVDLTGVDLEGVRWSERGTRWPASMDVDQLRGRAFMS